LKKEIVTLAKRSEELEADHEEVQERYEGLSENVTAALIRSAADTEVEEEPLSELAKPEAREQLKAAVEKILHEAEEERSKEHEESRRKRRERWAQLRMEDLAETLNLTEYQKTELEKVWDESQKKRRKLFGNIRETWDNEKERPELKDVRQQFGTIRKEENEKIQQVLSPDQYQAYEKYQEENALERFGRWGMGSSSPGDRPFGW
jgi:hypothetical protein